MSAPRKARARGTRAENRGPTPVARRPLTRGRQRTLFWGGYAGVGLALPLALSLLPASVRHRRGVRLAGAAATLAGGLCLRTAVVRGGEASALDPEAVLGEVPPR